MTGGVCQCACAWFKLPCQGRVVKLGMSTFSAYTKVTVFVCMSRHSCSVSLSHQHAYRKKQPKLTCTPFIIHTDCMYPHITHVHYRVRVGSLSHTHSLVSRKHEDVHSLFRIHFLPTHPSTPTDIRPVKVTV